MKKIIVLLIFTLAIFSNHFAQQNRIDSIKQVVHTTDQDTVKIKSYLRIGVFYEYRMPDTALYYYHKALTVAKNNKESKFVAMCNNFIGIVYDNKSAYNKALIYYKEALRIYENINRKSGVSLITGNIGVIYYNQKNYPKALEFYQRALVIEHKLKRGEGILRNLVNIGVVYQNQGNFPKALENYQEALNMSRKIDRKQQTAIILGNIGGVYLLDKQYSRSLKYLEEALKLNKELGRRNGIASNLGNIGIIYQRQGNFQLSLECYQESLDIEMKLGNRLEIASTLENIGVYYFSQKKYSKALELFKKAFNIRQEIGVKDGLTYQRLSSIYWSLGEVNNAVVHFNTMINLNSENILLNFSILPESAKLLYFAGLKEDYWRYNSFVLFNRDSFPEMTARVYNTAVKNKGLLLKSNTAMRHAIYDSKDTSLINLYEEWIVLKTQLAKKYAKGEDVTILKDKADSLEGNLVKNSNEFSDFKKTQNIDWKQVQNGLKENEVAVEFTHFPLLNPDSSFIDFTNEVQYVALLIDKNSEYPKMIPLFKEKQLEEVLGKLTGNNYSYINEVYGTQSKENKALYNLIWKPIEKQVQGAKKVFLSPSGLLHKVSFSAIAKSQNVYLCDVYDIEVKSSTGKIIDSGNEKQELNTASLFGGINYGTETTDQKIWKYLDGTKTETENINKILMKGKLDVSYFSSTAATEAKFKETSSSANILHIATHGFFYPDPSKVQEEIEKNTEYGDITFRGNQGYGVNSFIESRNPLMRSGLVLAGANDVWSQQVKSDSIEDGVLTAEEVSNIDLRKTELVVMSACESGLGDIQGSEGVYGLQRSFKMAGVNRIIMSLWQVPDKETSEFMGRFYKKLVKQKDIKKAFLETQKEMRDKYDPFYWAAFVLLD